MKTLIWKELREQRLFFFVSIGLILLIRMIFIIFLFFNKGKEYIEYLDYADSMAHFILPILFSLLLGVIPFTNEFTRNTKYFLLTHPLVSKNILIKYFSGLYFF